MYLQDWLSGAVEEAEVYANSKGEHIIPPFEFRDKRKNMKKILDTPENFNIEKFLNTNEEIICDDIKKELKIL